MTEFQSRLGSLHQRLWALLLWLRSALLGARQLGTSQQPRSEPSPFCHLLHIHYSVCGLGGRFELPCMHVLRSALEGDGTE